MEKVNESRLIDQLIEIQKELYVEKTKIKEMQTFYKERFGENDLTAYVINLAERSGQEKGNLMFEIQQARREIKRLNNIVKSLQNNIFSKN